MFKSHLIKSNHTVQRKNKVGTYGAPDYSATVLAAQKSANSNEQSVYILDFYGQRHELSAMRGLSAFHRCLWVKVVIN